ncbi:MAG: BON domain-containing protein [Chloroflexota bacterium]
MRIGSVCGLTITRATDELTHLVVRRGLVRRHVRLVPFEMVDNVDEERVALRPSRDGPESETSLTEVASPPFPGGPRTIPTITAETRAVLKDRDVGTIAMVLVDSTTRCATHFVVHHGGLVSRRLIVPLDRVIDMTTDRIVFGVSPDELVALPEYREDDKIAADAEEAISNDEILRRLSARFLAVAVSRGVVTVTGNLATSANRPRIEHSIRGVRGVLDVRNLPIGDDELEISVAAALGRDPRTRRFIVPVHSTHGFVRLTGDVPAVALDLARVVPGVRTVEIATSDAKLAWT